MTFVRGVPQPGTAPDWGLLQRERSAFELGNQPRHPSYLRLDGP